MALFTFKLDLGGAARKFSALVDATQGEALDTALLRTGGVIRARTKRDVFGTEGAGSWQALDPETVKRKMTLARAQLLTSHGRGVKHSVPHLIVREAAAIERTKVREAMLQARLEMKRAKGHKTDATEKSIAVALTRQRKAIDYLRSKRFAATAAGFASTAALIAFAQREVERAKVHGAALRAFKAAKKAGHRFSPEEQRALLLRGKRRYNVSEASSRMLGGLEDSISLNLVEGKRIEVFSHAFIGAIHNFGGTAGNGARIPARKFMFLVDSDITFLVELLKEQMIKAWLDEAPDSATHWQAYYAEAA